MLSLIAPVIFGYLKRWKIIMRLFVFIFLFLRITSLFTMEIMLINPRYGNHSFHYLTPEQVALLDLEAKVKGLTITISDDRIKDYQTVFAEFLERILYGDDRVKKYLENCSYLYELNYLLEMIEARGDLADLVKNAWAIKYAELYGRVKAQFKKVRE
jgi:hypothetical protein